MTPAAILTFLQQQSLGVQTSTSPEGAPQAAVVGLVVTDRFEIVFDTIETTRKVVNLRQHPRCAFVIGGFLAGDERTVQYEGVADEPTGDELTRLREAYFRVFPDGRARLAWPGLIHVRVRPRWLRYSDFNQSPAVIVELSF